MFKLFNTTSDVIVCHTVQFYMTYISNFVIIINIIDFNDNIMRIVLNKNLSL